MNFAIVGMGFIYPRHRKSIEDLGHKVVLTCDIDSTKNPDYTDWIEMFHSEEFKEVDVVSICTPNYLHSVIAREAILLNKKVLCEKPLTVFNDYQGLENVYTVLQLRYNPKVNEAKLNLKEDNNEISITAKVFRDEGFWYSWKGYKVKAGNPILHIIGVHYLDLLIYLLGEPIEVYNSDIHWYKATGGIRFKKGFATFHLEITPTREEQTRNVIINGESIKLSDQDNLSYEDLHKEVYKDFIQGNGIKLEEAKKSLDLINEIQNMERS